MSPELNAYLFSAGVTLSQMRPSGTRGSKTLQTWDTCMTAIIHGGDADRAQKTFEDWCQTPREGGDAVHTEIKLIVCAEMIDHLLTELGDQQLNWPGISERLFGSVPTIEPETEAPAAAEDPGEGYWVDVNQAVPPQSASLDLESLKRGSPEDIRSALNWSADKQFLFLVSSLSAPPVVTDLSEEIEETDSGETAELEQGDARPVLDEAVTRLPEMREKEAAALVEARNSVVAAWLWRKFAANTRLASNEILVNPCCGIMPAN